MLIKPSLPLTIPEDDPFKNDVLDRKKIARPLTELINHIEEPFVLSLGSSFGTGKTTFLRMWMQSLKNDGYKCISFNAWENDFIEDPLVALIGAINPQILKIDDRPLAKVSALYEKTKKIGIKLMKRSIPLAVKAATLGAIDAGKEYEEIVASLTDQLANDMIDSYQEQVDAVESFKNSLGEYASEYSKSSDSSEAKPLIFLIDELDRCRPTFAIELLERIKHIFNIPGIVFVLAYDKSQLASACRTIYGKDLDIDGYLRRFIDLEFNLPKPSAEKFVKLLFNKYELEEYFAKRTVGDLVYEKNDLRNLLMQLFSIFNFSLRKQEQCFIQLSIALHTTPHNHILLPFILAPMITLKAVNSQLYYKFIAKEIAYKEIIIFFREQPGGSEMLDEHLGEMMEAFLAICNANSDKRRAYKEEYKSIAENESLQESEKHRANTINKIMIDLSHAQTTSELSYIVEKLEFLAKFHDFATEDESAE